jgi:hypothetical protein
MSAASNEIRGTSRIVIHEGKLEEFMALKWKNLCVR